MVQYSEENPPDNGTDSGFHPAPFCCPLFGFSILSLYAPNDAMGYGQVVLACPHQASVCVYYSGE